MRLRCCRKPGKHRSRRAYSSPRRCAAGALRVCNMGALDIRLPHERSANVEQRSGRRADLDAGVLEREHHLLPSLSAMPDDWRQRGARNISHTTTGGRLMISPRTLAVLLAFLMTLSLIGCAREDTSS